MYTFILVFTGILPSKAPPGPQMMLPCIPCMPPPAGACARGGAALLPAARSPPPAFVWLLSLSVFCLYFCSFRLCRCYCCCSCRRLFWRSFFDGPLLLAHVSEQKCVCVCVRARVFVCVCYATARTQSSFGGYLAQERTTHLPCLTAGA